jgi:uncharacterized surface protein with fasciclin (FAS1) repeats
MSSVRLFVGAAAVLLAGPALAQTGGAGGYGSTAQPTGAGAMQSPSTAARPYAPPPVTGGPAQPSAASGPAMASAPAPSAPPAAFTPLQPNPSASIVAALQASGEFNTLVAALKATNLANLLSTHPQLTLFAPTDAAFAQLPPGQVDQLMKSPAQLQAILTYHLVAIAIRPAEIEGHTAGPVKAADNKQLTVDGSGQSIRVNDATVLQPGVPVANGFIYPIDKVLTPPGA